MSDTNGTRRNSNKFQWIPSDSNGSQWISPEKNIKKSEDVGKSRKFMIRLFMIRLWPFPRKIFESNWIVLLRFNRSQNCRNGSYPSDFFRLFEDFSLQKDIVEIQIIWDTDRLPALFLICWRLRVFPQSNHNENKRNPTGHQRQEVTFCTSSFSLLWKIFDNIFGILSILAGAQSPPDLPLKH